MDSFIYEVMGIDSDGKWVRWCLCDNWFVAKDRVRFLNSQGRDVNLVMHRCVGDVYLHFDTHLYTSTKEDSTNQ